MFLPETIRRVVRNLSNLPGIGKRSAMRIAFYLLQLPESEVSELAESLIALHEKLHPCSVCGFVTDKDPCGICGDESRDKGLLCVVEDSQDVISIENAGVYEGLYHVLGGALSPYSGVGPERLRIKELLDRVKSGNFREIIIATNPKIEGDMTFYYLVDVLKPLGIKVTRLAYGLPVGGDIEYADGMTLRRAIENRFTVIGEGVKDDRKQKE